MVCIFAHRKNELIYPRNKTLMKRIKLILSMLLAALLLPTSLLAQTTTYTSTFNDMTGPRDHEGHYTVYGELQTSEGNDWYYTCNTNHPWLISKTSVSGSFALSLNDVDASSFKAELASFFKMQGYVTKVTVRAGGNLGQIKAKISGGRSLEDCEIGTADATSSDVKDYEFTVYKETSYVDCNSIKDEYLDVNWYATKDDIRFLYVTLTPKSKSGDLIIESIKIEVSQEYVSEEGDSGTCGDLMWKIEDGSHLTISGKGNMKDFNWVRDPETYKQVLDAPWAKFSLTSVEIKEGVTSIGKYAFYGQSLNSVTLPEGLNLIDEYAFAQNNNLASITIPKSVTSVSYYAFVECSALKTIIVEEGNLFYDSRNNCNAIIKTNNNEIAIGCMGTVIPSTVTSIGTKAFYCCDIESIEIPASVTNIGSNAFESCQKLKNLVLLDNVTEIGSSAFFKCSAMETLTIGSGVTYIGGDAFRSMNNLSDIYCTANPENLTWNGNEKSICCKSDGSTKFHVTDPAAWKAKFPNAHVQFVAIGSVETDEGDANGDGEIDVADIDFVIEHIGEPIDDTNKASDVNGDGEINVADVDYIIERIK